MNPNIFPPIADKTKSKLEEIMKDTSKCEAFAETFYEEFITDDERLDRVGYYMAKAIINENVDELLVALCGWSANTLLDKLELKDN